MTAAEILSADFDAPTGADRTPVVRPEPMTAAELFRPISDKHPRALLLGVEKPDDAKHPFGGMCKACMEAGRETRLDVLWRQLHAELAPGWFAVNCCDQCYEEAKSDAETLTKQREWWAEHCPVEFRDEWNPAKGSAKLLSRVLGFDPKRGRGLVIHGPTDTGKTRAVWRLLRKLAEEGHEWLFVEAIDLLDSIPERAFTVPVLVIDDLGNDALTAQKEVRLLKLLRKRCDWHRPFIVTTQFVGDSLEKRFTETATAKAVIRRLRKFCDDIRAESAA